MLEGNQDPRHYDVVLLCPYLPHDQRDALLETCLAAPDGTVIELLDSDEGSRVLLHRAGASCAGAADAVAEALALPLDERDALLETCLAAPDGTVVELLDSDEGSRVLLHRAGVAVAGAANAVAAALALPLEPAHA